MRCRAEKGNAPGEGGVPCVPAGEPGATQKLVDCDASSIADVCQELTAAGVALRSTSGASQLDTLRRALEYRGARGLNTYEGMAAGYLRMATRVKELRNTWDIHTVRENVVAPDGLVHKSVARYILHGRRQELPAPAAPQSVFPGV